MAQLDHLARRAVTGDDGAIADLVALAFPDVVRLCGHLGSGFETDDLVQDTFLRVVRSLPRFRFECEVRTWILSIARNTCADAVRNVSRRRQREHDGPAVDAPESGDMTLRIELTQALDSVPFDFREAFVMTQMFGLSYAEAAEAIGVPIGTVRSRVARCRALLIEAVDLGGADDLNNLSVLDTTSGTL